MSFFVLSEIRAELRGDVACPFPLFDYILFPFPLFHMTVATVRELASSSQFRAVNTVTGAC
jgi:hypothetical protein